MMVHSQVVANYFVFDYDLLDLCHKPQQLVTQFLNLNVTNKTHERMKHSLLNLCMTPGI